MGERLDEAYAYIQVAARDPSTWLHAALHGWDYPLTYEAIFLLDLIDLTGSANSDKKHRWKPVKRPWKNGRRFGQTAIPIDEAKERLAGRGQQTNE